VRPILMAMNFWGHDALLIRNRNEGLPESFGER
jgi:hypothetical protein